MKLEYKLKEQDAQTKSKTIRNEYDIEDYKK